MNGSTWIRPAQTACPECHAPIVGRRRIYCSPPCRQRVAYRKWRLQNLERARAENREWARKNREKKNSSARKSQRNYREQNRERIRAYSRKRYREQRELILETGRAWRREHRQRLNALARARYTKRPPDVVLAAWQQWQRDHPKDARVLKRARVNAAERARIAKDPERHRARSREKNFEWKIRSLPETVKEMRRTLRLYWRWVKTHGADGRT